MKILALETSDTAGEIALLEGERLVLERLLDPKQKSARSLAPALHSALAHAGWSSQDIELIGVTSGPGSFTGLRVGVTTAKTLAYLTGATVVAVNTLEAVAEQARPTEPPCPCIWAVIDAQRQQLFAAAFARDDAGKLRFIRGTHVIDIDQWLGRVNEGEVVIGPGLTKIVDRLPPHAVLAPPETWRPRAATVGAVAWRKFQSGQRDDVWRLAPQYFRLSAAEEKLLEEQPAPPADPRGE